jgi:hypothetical protein
MADEAAAAAATSRSVSVRIPDRLGLPAALGAIGCLHDSDLSALGPEFDSEAFWLYAPL